MKLRAPAIPLITVDPYFSVWAPHEVLNYRRTVHWTGAENSLCGKLTVDGVEYSFLGYQREAKKMRQEHMDIDALSTRYTFSAGGVSLFVRFTTPLLPDELEIMTRPVSYMELSYAATDGAQHEVSVSVYASDSLCLNHPQESPVTVEECETELTRAVRIGNTVQKPLNRSGDDLRIDWGYFYIATVKGEGIEAKLGKRSFSLSCPMTEGENRLYLFAYDDLGKSINYFGKELCSYWNKNGESIAYAIDAAVKDRETVFDRCDDFSDRLTADAYMAGGEKYADICSLAFRQVIAAHKLVVDDNGDILYISKECFSNGCAATVDVSYPSTPMLLLYAPELVKGMLRPIYEFAKSAEWEYDFAPHDAGQYPLVTGQVYGKTREGKLLHESQMPVEECGNMIIMEANLALAMGNADFAAEHLDLLSDWCKYLIKYGDDPENQLCTDDFAGHLAHNCNLSLKAIMGIMGMSVILNMLGKTDDSKRYEQIAREKAAFWCERAKNSDGSYRLAFDLEGSFSMKYNMVWDKIWGTGLFPEEVIEAELEANLTKFNKYGMPLDSRSEYTKSDWLVWTATLASSRAVFKRFIAPLWNAYNDTPDRVPMTDWYDTTSSMLVGFVHRTVQGGLFIKMLDESGRWKYRR